eukprot:CAMPEP_0185906208 /NCGR_PEP_ID=MMETSP0196C-20130402/5330_1 /TAXON_ID=2932 /ORGANISM="Alexandrium fundyense, Strain CCMP1719" /LENGTH=74 /DNA_ID=CAMNT_0028625887 /DNA_START=188 /DNA_END=409 /DNA_ORIENTATION=-
MISQVSEWNFDADGISGGSAQGRNPAAPILFNAVMGFLARQASYSSYSTLGKLRGEDPLGVNKTAALLLYFEQA